MTQSITYLQLTKSELEELAEKIVTRTVQKMARETGDVWKLKDVAKHFDVSEKTITTWERIGRIPARVNGFWSKAAILEIHQKGK